MYQVRLRLLQSTLLPPPTPGRFASVYLPLSATHRRTDPATVALTDANPPKSNSSKGTPIKILKWKEYVKRINIPAAWTWLLKPWMMWINRTDERAEQIVCSCNFVKIIGENATHYEIETLYNDVDTAALDPSNLNWLKTFAKP